MNIILTRFVPVLNIPEAPIILRNGGTFFLYDSHRSNPDTTICFPIEDSISDQVGKLFNSSWRSFTPASWKYCITLLFVVSDTDDAVIPWSIIFLNDALLMVWLWLLDKWSLLSKFVSSWWSKNRVNVLSMTRRARNRVNGPLCLLFMCEFTLRGSVRASKAACKAETGAVFNGN